MTIRTPIVTGKDARRAARAGSIAGPTCGVAPDYLQANLLVLPKAFAFDFMLFCQRNPRPCPLLEVTDPGSWEPAAVAPGADLRTDLPRYRVYRDGALVDEPGDVTRWWRPDLVSFLLGCSFSFEAAMQRAGLPLRHIDLARNVPMYRTSIPCSPGGVFRGPLVVSMRPLTSAHAIQAIEITARYPRAHGAPVHVGDPERIGITQLDRPDYGDAVDVRPGEVPVFWACGMTSQAALAEARPEIAITHSPGRMFVTDRLADDPR